MKRRSVWDILSIVILAGVVCVGGYYLLVFAAPQGPWNLFPPPTPVATLFVPTLTETPILFPATWTPTSTIALQPTVPPTATMEFTEMVMTLTPTATLFSLPTFTPTSTATITLTPTLEATRTLTPTITLTPTKAATLLLQNAIVTEGDSGTSMCTLNLIISPVGSKTITVDYFTRDGSAVANQDYIPTSGTLTIEKNISMVQISVAVIGDTFKENEEVFYVILRNAKNADIGDGQGNCIIKDNDTIVAPSATPVTPVPTAGTPYP